MNTAVVRHKKTNVLYQHISGNRFRNLSTGIEGEVPDEIAKNIFAINPDATALFNEHDKLGYLVGRLIGSGLLEIEVKNEQNENIVL